MQCTMYWHRGTKCLINSCGGDWEPGPRQKVHVVCQGLGVVNALCEWYPHACSDCHYEFPFAEGWMKVGSYVWELAFLYGMFDAIMRGQTFDEIKTEINNKTRLTSLKGKRMVDPNLGTLTVAQVNAVQGSPTNDPFQGMMFARRITLSCGRCRSQLLHSWLACCAGSRQR